jgi:hypothetical protein
MKFIPKEQYVLIRLVVMIFFSICVTTQSLPERGLSRLTSVFDLATRSWGNQFGMVCANLRGSLLSVIPDKSCFGDFLQFAEDWQDSRIDRLNFVNYIYAHFGFADALTKHDVQHFWELFDDGSVMDFDFATFIVGNPDYYPLEFEDLMVAIKNPIESAMVRTKSLLELVPEEVS